LPVQPARSSLRQPRDPPPCPHALGACLRCASTRRRRDRLRPSSRARVACPGIPWCPSSSVGAGSIGTPESPEAVATLRRLVAKKSRTPPPPRRPVQAPKQRTAPRTPRERRTMLYLMIFAGSGLGLLGAALAIVAFAGGGKSGN